MALVKMSDYTAPKSRPKKYMARDAAYPVGGNPGKYIASRPRPYPITPQQRKVRDLAEKCGIKAGITKKVLQVAMKECVGPGMRR